MTESLPRRPHWPSSMSGSLLLSPRATKRSTLRGASFCILASTFLSAAAGDSPVPMSCVLLDKSMSPIPFLAAWAPAFASCLAPRIVEREELVGECGSLGTCARFMLTSAGRLASASRNAVAEMEGGGPPSLSASPRRKNSRWTTTQDPRPEEWPYHRGGTAETAARCPCMSSSLAAPP